MSSLLQMGNTLFGIKAWFLVWNNNESLLYKVFNQRPPMFGFVRLWKQQKCCEPKIGGETPLTNKLSS